MPQDGIGVQQALGRMFVHAVTGVDDGYLQVSGEQVRRSGRGMPDHDAVGAQGLERFAGIHQRLAFFNAGRGGADHRGMCAQQFGGKFERDAGAGGGFVKKQGNALALEQRTGPAQLHLSRQL